MADPLFTPEAKLILESDDRGEMGRFSEALHPATVADALTDAFEVPEVWRFLENAPISSQAAIFAYFPVETQLALVEGGSRDRMARLIEEMSSDDRADLLRQLPEPVRDSLLRLVDEADRKDIAKLIQYPANTAGALMTTDYAWLPGNITVEDALERLRKQAPDAETIYYVYIVDEHRHLQGVVSLRDLILAPRRAIVSDIMEERVVSVRDTEDREQVANLFAEYDLLAMPVVDGDNRLVGIITSDDVLDVVQEEATEDVHRMGGVGPLEENYMEASFFQIWRNRAFWLSMLFVAELFTFSALSAFEDAIARVVVLALFVPLCISTGGNSGSQAATLITRAMALGQITARDWFKVLRHEIGMGVVLGVTLGVIGFVRASFTPEGVRSSSPPRPEGFKVMVPAGASPLNFEPTTKRTWLGLGPDETEYSVKLPPGTRQEMTSQEATTIELPEDTTP